MSKHMLNKFARVLEAKLEDAPTSDAAAALESVLSEVRRQAAECPQPTLAELGKRFRADGKIWAPASDGVFTKTVNDRTYDVVTNGACLVLVEGGNAGEAGFPYTVEGFLEAPLEILGTTASDVLVTWAGQPIRLKTCRQCHGTGTLECTWCAGRHKYETQCACGQTHECVCRNCDEHGRSKCEKCSGQGVRLRKRDRGRIDYGRIGALTVDRCFLASALASLPVRGRIRVDVGLGPGRSDGTSANMVRFVGDGWFVIQMGLDVSTAQIEPAPELPITPGGQDYA